MLSGKIYCILYFRGQVLFTCGCKPRSIPRATFSAKVYLFYVVTSTHASTSKRCKSVLFGATKIFQRALENTRYINFLRVCAFFGAKICLVQSGANRCFSVQFGAPQCFSVKFGAPRCFSVQLGAGCYCLHEHSCKKSWCKGCRLVQNGAIWCLFWHRIAPIKHSRGKSWCKGCNLVIHSFMECLPVAMVSVY